MRTRPTAISESRREGPTVKGRVSRVQYTGVECTLSRGTQPWSYRNVHNSSPHTTTSVGRFSCPDCTLSIGDSRWGPNAPRDTPRKEVSQGRLGEDIMMLALRLAGRSPLRVQRQLSYRQASINSIHLSPTPVRAVAGLGGWTPPTRVRPMVVSLYTPAPAQSVAMSADTDGLPPRLGIDRFHAPRQHTSNHAAALQRTHHPRPYPLRRVSRGYRVPLASRTLPEW